MMQTTRLQQESKDPPVSVKHAGGSVMAWAFKATSGTGSLIFIDDVL